MWVVIIAGLLSTVAFWPEVEGNIMFYEELLNASLSVPHCFFLHPKLKRVVNRLYCRKFKLVKPLAKLRFLLC